MPICRGNKVATIEKELRAAEETLEATKSILVNTIAQVSSTVDAWEALRKKLEQALKDGMESWSVPPSSAESQQQTIANDSFERLLQKHAEFSQQVTTECLIKRNLIGIWSPRLLISCIVCTKVDPK